MFIRFLFLRVKKATEKNVSEEVVDSVGYRNCIIPHSKHLHSTNPYRVRWNKEKSNLTRNRKSNIKNKMRKNRIVNCQLLIQNWSRVLMRFFMSFCRLGNWEIIFILLPSCKTQETSYMAAFSAISNWSRAEKVALNGFLFNEVEKLWKFLHKSKALSLCHFEDPTHFKRLLKVAASTVNSNLTVKVCENLCKFTSQKLLFFNSRRAIN